MSTTFAFLLFACSDDAFMARVKALERLNARLPAATGTPEVVAPDVSVPLGFVPYKSATVTQQIYTSNGRPRIDWVSRTQLERKWQVPGGLDGVTGWRSDLYQKQTGWQWTERMPVLNSFGYYQYEVGYTRAYDDGSMFLDILTNTATGKVFEIRVAEKRRGRWIRSVDYRDIDQRPAGYKRVRSRDCRTCHEQAGTGNYAGPLVPGNDTVISAPFRGVGEP